MHRNNTVGPIAFTNQLPSGQRMRFCRLMLDSATISNEQSEKMPDGFAAPQDNSRKSICKKSRPR